MIITKYYRTREDGVDLNITTSTEGLKIRKVGTDEIYDEAIDVAETGRDSLVVSRIALCG